MIGPWNAIATPAALTETLATFLCTATVVACLPSVMGSRRLGWPIAAGVFLALAVLTRPDALTLAPAVALAIWGVVRARATGPALADRLRATRRPLVLAVVAFVLVFAPWPIRNLLVFHHPHPLGGRIDRYSQPVEHYQGSWAFLRAISHNWRPMTWLTTCYYDRGCTPTLGDFVGANQSLDPHERAEIVRLLALRSQVGHTEEVSRGFQALADRRRREHFLEVEVAYPASRLETMWIADHDELLPVYAPMHGWAPKMRGWSRRLVGAAALGALCILLDRRRRLAGLVLIAAVLGRTAVMAYTFYSMPRYSLESVPSAFALIACGAGVLLSWIASALRRARSSTKSTSGVLSASMNT
jgi:hypothetical protein